MKRYVLAVTLVLATVLVFCASSAYAEKSISSESESIRGVSVMYGGESLACTVAMSTGTPIAIGSFSVEISPFRKLAPASGQPIEFIDQDGAHYFVGTPNDAPHIEYPPTEFTSYSGRFLCNVLTHTVDNANVEWSGELDDNSKLRSISIRKKNFAAQTVYDPCGSNETCTIKGVVKGIGGVYLPVDFVPFQGPTPSGSPTSFCNATLELDEGGKVSVTVSSQQPYTDSPMMKVTSMFDACNLLSLAFGRDVPVRITIDDHGKLIDNHRVTLGAAPIVLMQPTIFQRIENFFRYIRIDAEKRDLPSHKK